MSKKIKILKMNHRVPTRKNKFRQLGKKNAISKIRHAEFVSLIYIRNTNIAMDKDLQEILRILKELQVLSRKSRMVFKTNCTLSQHILWEVLINKINDNINCIRLQIEYIKENTIKINHFNHSLFWKQNETFLNLLKESFEKIDELSSQILPQEERLTWKTNIGSNQEEFFYMMLPLLNICKIELDFIKTHTPANLKKVMQNVIEDIPQISFRRKYNRYGHAYIQALEQYKKEFGEKHSFWDILVKVLTIDMRKSPSELVMLGRWIDGKNKHMINSK